MRLLGLAAAIAAAGALGYGARRWRAATDALHAGLAAARRAPAPATYRASELRGLPAPVERYSRAVLTDGQPVVAAVRIEHTGRFNLSATGDRWRPFRSTQRVVTRRPGFDWEARVALAPGLAVRVHDAYVAGEGILQASLFGLVTVAALRGTPAAAQGKLLRFLAEAVWYPTALLPSQGVAWAAVDAASAQEHRGRAGREQSEPAAPPARHVALPLVLKWTTDQRTIAFGAYRNRPRCALRPDEVEPAT